MAHNPHRRTAGPDQAAPGRPVVHDLLPVAGVPMTLRAYLNTPEGLGYNLLDGLCCRDEPTVEHQAIVGNIIGLLQRYARGSGFGRALPAINVDLGERNQPAPDACLVSRERCAALHGRALHGIAPDLCVEVLSPSTAGYDRGHKAKLYARHGCREYWIVDGRHRRVEVYRTGGHTAFCPGRRLRLRRGFPH